MNTYDNVHAAVLEREAAQIAKHGVTHHPDGTSVDNQGLADLARESCQNAFSAGCGSWLDILLEEVMEASAEEDADKLFNELIDIAATATSWARQVHARQDARLPMEVSA